MMYFLGVESSIIFFTLLHDGSEFIIHGMDFLFEFTNLRQTRLDRIGRGVANVLKALLKVLHLEEKQAHEGMIIKWGE